MVRSCPFVAGPNSRMTVGRGDGTGSRAGRVWGSRKAVCGSGHGRRQMRNGGVRGGNGRTGRRKEDGGSGRQRWGLGDGVVSGKLQTDLQDARCVVTRGEDQWKKPENRSKKNHTRDGVRPDSPLSLYIYSIYIYRVFIYYTAGRE
jgi:hypothetical protein